MEHCSKCARCARCAKKTELPYMCLLCGRTYCSQEGHSSKCSMGRSKMWKSCFCRWMINTGLSGVVMNYSSHSVYPFGSIYYTDHNSTSTRDWPSVRLTKSERACAILEHAIRNDMVWFKTQMYEKIIVY